LDKLLPADGKFAPGERSREKVESAPGEDAACIPTGGFALEEIAVFSSAESVRTDVSRVMNKAKRQTTAAAKASEAKARDRKREEFMRAHPTERDEQRKVITKAMEKLAGVKWRIKVLFTAAST
jgi:hypothetical protein